MKVVFLPDRDVDRPGDLFRALVSELGLADYAVDGDVAGADFVAFIGRERAEAHFGRKVKSGPQKETLDGTMGNARVYVLPSTAPERRGKFYEGVWRSFATHVLGRDLAVRDEFKGLAPEDVKAALDARRYEFAVCCANVVYDFNLGSVVRTANAFLAAEFWIYGRKKADLRAAMGSYVYETVVHVPDEDGFAARVSEQARSVVVFEETSDAVELATFRWPPRPLLVFGQEGPGVPDELRARADHTVVIPQYGSIRSLNVGVAAGIAMFDWHAKRAR